MFKKLGDSFRENPENCVSKHSQIFEKMLSQPSYTMIAVNKNQIVHITITSYFSTANYFKCNLFICLNKGGSSKLSIHLFYLQIFWNE